MEWAKAGAIGAAAGIAGAFFLDPQQGKRRRHVLRDRAFGFLRRGSQEAQRKADYAAGHVEGAIHEARDAATGESPAPNDETLADRVRSEIFRPADAPKGSVNVNAEIGVVYLRGEVETGEQAEALAAAAAEVDGVRAVESLLHTPGEPAPMKVS